MFLTNFSRETLTTFLPNNIHGRQKLQKLESTAALQMHWYFCFLLLSS